MREVWLVRHGPTPANTERRYPHPHEDPALTSTGRAQAEALRDLLGDAWAQVLTSPAARARETARLAGHAGARVTADLAEAAFGCMAGHTWAELEAAHGATARAWIDALIHPNRDDGPPGGETGRAFHARIRRVLHDLPEGRSLLFTHAGVIRAALRVTVGLTAVTIRAANATVLQEHQGHWWLEGLNWPASTGGADRA